jgi:prevent-host-death family protein
MPNLPKLGTNLHVDEESEMQAQTVTSREVQTRFGAIMDMAKREHVTITQHGRPVVALVSVEDAAELRRIRAAREMMQFLSQLAPVPDAADLGDTDIAALVKKLR